MKKNQNSMSICIDIDNTICATKKNFYLHSKPIKSKIYFLNKLYDNGHKIILYTARFMGRNKNNPKKLKAKNYEFTYKQLKKWGLRFHELHLGKPSADLYIDDKSINFQKNWDLKLKELLK